jgi:hypothetical protein
MSIERRVVTEHGVPKAGAAVMTKDGERVGKVSEISGNFFKVDAPMRRDFWLSVDYVGLCAPDRVHLEFEKKELDEHKLTEPGLEPEEDPMREMARDAVILTDEELLEQRARMERELAEQRKDLPIHQQPGGDDSGTIGEPVESELARLEEELGVAGRPGSSVSSSTGAVVPPQQHIEPESPSAAHQRVEEEGVAHADAVTEDVTGAFSSMPEGSVSPPANAPGAGWSQSDVGAPYDVGGAGRSPMRLAIGGAVLAAAGFLTLRFLRSRRSRRSLATRGKELLEDARAALPTH